MTKSAVDAPLGIVRSAAVISLGVVALAGSIASVLVRRILTPAAAEPARPQITKLVADEWEADLARLNLPKVAPSIVQRLDSTAARPTAPVNGIQLKREAA